MRKFTLFFKNIRYLFRKDHYSFFKNVNFSLYNQYHIDTRSFETLCLKKPYPVNTPPHLLLKKDRLFFSEYELKKELTRLFNESGGHVSWRYLMLDSFAESYTEKWQLKFMHIYRTEHGLLVFDSLGRIISKKILSMPVNKEYLFKH